MTNFLADNFSNCVFVAVLLLAMFPMVESKVAIPFALSSLIWGDMVMSPIAAFFVALIGSALPSVFVILLMKKVKSKTSGFVHDKFLNGLESKYKKKLDAITGKTSVFKKCLYLCTFVAIPLPLTGVYTGSLIAGLTSLKVWQGFVSVLIGDIISCIVVLLLCVVFENSAFYIFIMSLVIISVFVLIQLIMYFVEKIRERHKEIQIN